MRPRPSETTERGGVGLGLLPLLQGQPARQCYVEWGVCEPGWRERRCWLVCHGYDSTLCAPQLFHLQNDAAAFADLESSFQLGVGDLQFWVLEFSGLSYSETANF